MDAQSAPRPDRTEARTVRLWVRSLLKKMKLGFDVCSREREPLLDVWSGGKPCLSAVRAGRDDVEMHVLRASAKIRRLHLFFALESLAHVSQ
jgi:hypothetical protein